MTLAPDAFIPSPPPENASMKLLLTIAPGLTAHPEALVRIPAWLPAPCDQSRTELPVMVPPQPVQWMPSSSASRTVLSVTDSGHPLTVMPGPDVEVTWLFSIEQ